MKKLNGITIDDLKSKLEEMTKENIININPVPNEDSLNTVDSFDHEESQSVPEEKSNYLKEENILETSCENIKEIKSKIVKEIIVPNYYIEIRDTVKATKKWKKSSNLTELFSKILTGLATIVAFSAGAYTEYTFLSFIAGCIGTGSLVCQQFSTYARGEARERISQANKILHILGIESIPDVLEE
jgi:phosphate/sulfate permease